MWANAQLDGRPVEYRWRPLFDAQFGWRPLLECRAVTLSRREPRWNLQEGQAPEPTSAVSGPKFTIGAYYKDMWSRYCCLTNIFPIIDRLTCLSCEDIAGQSCAMVPRWRISGQFLHSVFSASHVQHVSHQGLHSKFALGHTMCGSMVDIPCATARIRRKKKKERRKKKSLGKNIM